MNDEEKPHITVSTVVFKENKFLLVEEKSFGKTVFNQPAGHLENGETLIEAAKRETLEETAWHVDISHFLGISQYLAPNNITYIRVSFVGEVLSFDSHVNRDEDIIDITWKTYDEIRRMKSQLRSPLVLNDIERYRQKQIHELNLLQGFLQDF